MFLYSWIQDIITGNEQNFTSKFKPVNINTIATCETFNTKCSVNCEISNSMMITLHWLFEKYNDTVRLKGTS